MVQIKRAYESVSKNDGYRVLVDRMWPRGIKKESLQLDEWMKELAPSPQVRKDFGHKSENWKSFQSQYKKELKKGEAKEKVKQLVDIAKKSKLSLIYGARDEEHNNAVVLKEIIEKTLTK